MNLDECITVTSPPCSIDNNIMTSKPTTTAIPPHVTAVKPVTASTLQVMGGGVGAARGNVGLGRSVPTAAASLQGHGTNKTGGTGKVLLIPDDKILYLQNKLLIAIQLGSVRMSVRLSIRTSINL